MNVVINHNKIVFVTISMRGGGTERVISLLADYYVSNGHTVEIMMIGDDRVEYEIDERVDVYSISKATGGNPIERLKRIANMRKHLAKDKNSIIIAMGTVAAMFTSIASFGLTNRVIISERNDPNRLNHRPIKSYEKMIRNILYRRADKIVFQTRMASECFPNYLTKRGCVILNPLNIDKETDLSINDTTRSHTVITAGRLTEQKNHKLLIDAFEEFDELHAKDRYKLWIFGKGELEGQLSEYIADKHLDDKVVLKGFSDNLHDELRQGGIYVSSSDWEGISNSLAEAMACGIPVIATDCPVGGSAMLIKNGENGLLINVGDKDALVQAMNMLADDRELYNKISKQGEAIANELRVEDIAKQWLQI